MNTLIVKKLKDSTILHGVQVIEQSSPYRSKRCSSCGYVHEANRKSKSFKCRKCGFQSDADYNASCNHTAKLSEIRFGERHSFDHKAGLYWLEFGFRTMDVQEITVPGLKKELIDTN